MRYFYGSLLIFLFLAFVLPAEAQAPEVGSETLIKLSRETASEGETGSGSSRSRNALVEVVLGKTESAVELEYRLPPGSEGRAGPTEWMFPVRIRKSSDDQTEVLNRTELLARRDAWLEKAPQFRALCGKSVFTWTVVHIHCEVDDVLRIVAAFDLWVWDVSPERMWQEPGTTAPQSLTLVENGPNGQRYEVAFNLDPEALRRADAEVEISVAMMTGKPTPTLEDALSELANVAYSGSLVLSFQTDAFGTLIERTWLQEIAKMTALGQRTSYLTTTSIQRNSVP